MYLSANKVPKFVFAVAEFKDFGQSLKYSQKTFLTLSFVRSGTNMKECLNRKLFLFFHQTSRHEKYQRSLKLKKNNYIFYHSSRNDLRRNNKTDPRNDHKQA